MTTERIDIIVSENGSRVVKKNMEGIGDGAKKGADGVELLQRALIGLTAVMSANKLAEYAGIWTDLNARVARFAGTAANTEAVMSRLMTIAQRTYAPLESTAEIYLENAFALQQLGKSTAESLDYTEAMTNALVVSGAKGQRAQSVIAALSKSMLEGKLKGDNWNTVLTQGGRIVEALTQETGKSLTELKQMASAGQLTSDTVFNALIKQLQQLREEADEMPATIGDAFIRLRNRVIEVIGKINQDIEAEGFVVSVIDLINQHLDKILPVLAGIAVAILTAFAPSVILQFTAALKILFAMIMAHPFVALAAAIAGVITTLYLLRDQIKLGIDDTTTLGDLMRAMWESIAPAIEAVVDFVKQAFSIISDVVGGAFNYMSGASEEYQKREESTWLSLVRIVMKVFDAIGATIRAVMLAVGRTIGEVIGNAVERFRSLGNIVTKTLRGDFSGAGLEISELMRRDASLIGDVGAIWGDTFREEFKSQAEGGLEAWLDGRIKRAQEIGANRQNQEVADLSGKSGSVGNIVDPEAAKALKKLKDDLQALIGQYDRVYAAQMELKKATELLDKAEKAGLITAERKAEVLELINEQLRDQLDPLGAINRELDKELKLLSMTTDAREVEAQIMAITQDLRMAGVRIGETEIEQLREKLKLIQEQTKLDQMVNSMRSQTRGGRDEDFSLQAQALKRLQSSGDATEADSFNMLNQMLGGSLDQTQSAFEARLAQFDEFYARIQELRELDVISAQQAAEAMNAIDDARRDYQIERVQTGLDTIAGLMNTQNKKAFKVGQAAAIAQVAIKTPEAAMNAYNSMAGIPYVGPILGGIAAAAAVALGMAQISKIRSQTPPQFRTGGEYVVGGYGGVDSQNVAFRATPGERISINTPSQAHAMQNVERMMREEGGGRRGNFTQNLTIVQQGRPNRRTSEQEAKKVRKATQAEYERNN